MAVRLSSKTDSELGRRVRGIASGPGRKPCDMEVGLHDLRGRRMPVADCGVPTARIIGGA